MNGDPAVQWTFVAIVALAGIAMLRSHYAKSKADNATANHVETNTDASAQLFEHYQREITALRDRIDEVSNRLGKAETELAKVEEMYKASAAGERRYRYAFAKLLHASSRLMAVARAHVPPAELDPVEHMITHIMAELAKPLDTNNLDPEVEIFGSDA